MTEQEAEQLYQNALNEFGDQLPNPEHFPRTFAYYLKLYQYIQSTKQEVKDA